MRRTPACLLALMLGIASSFAAATDPPASQNAPDEPMTAQERLDAAADAFNAGQPQKARELVQELLEMPAFLDLPEFEQYRALLVAAYCAIDASDALEAHDYLVAATSFQFAEVDTWKRRAYAAQQMEDWSDSLLALTTIARRWPHDLKGDAADDWIVTNGLAMAERDPTLREQRLALMSLMFDAAYTQEFETQPDSLWLELAADALQRGDLPRARTISRRIAGSGTLVQINSDRRFDALVAAEPSLRDVRGAALREKQRLEKLLAANPRSLGVLLRYTYALFALGEFTEMRRLANAAVAKLEKAPPDQPAFDDSDTYLAWLHNQEALALLGLGREEESIRVLTDWQHDPRNTQNKSSQSINLGSMLNHAGRPQAALDAVADIDWANELNPYGRMQLQSVRHEAYLQLDRADDAQTVLAWIREHQQDSPATARAALVKAGDLDGAAALLIAGLEAPATRAATLASLQVYKRPPSKNRSDFRRRAADNLRHLLERADVKAAIEKYGRAGSYPVYHMQ
jgi:hypothetical protein